MGSFEEDIQKMKVLKKGLAVLLAVFLAVSAAGCSAGDVSYVVKTDSITVKPGVYVGYLMDAYLEASSKIEDQGQSPINQTIDGINGGEWINKRALENVKCYIAIEKKFDEMGLTFDTAAETSASNLVSNILNSYSTLYEDNGCNAQSLLLIAKNTVKSNMIFAELYGKGGEFEIAESEIKAQFEKDYVEVRGVVASLLNTDGTALSEADRQVYLDKLGESAQRIKNGESFDTVSKDYQKWYAEKRSITFNESDYNSEEQYTLVGKSNTNLTTSIVTDMFDAKVGEVRVVSDATMAMMYLKNDPNRDAAQLETVRASIMKTLKTDEYREKTLGWAGDLGITVNDNAVGYYTAQKIH